MMKPLFDTSPNRYAYAAAILLALGISACVTTENTVALGNPYASLTFSGYASAPGATVEIYAFDKCSGGWEPAPIESRTAGDRPFTLGGRTIYSWHMSTPLLDQNDSDTLCRLSPDRKLVEASIRVKFVEVDGSYNPLLTFDDGGVSCTVEKVGDGKDLYTAAWECKGTIHDELSIPVAL